MIPIQEALEVLRKNAPAPSVEQRALEKCAGLILAEDAAAARPSPPYTNSAMDGFAVIWDDVQAADTALNVIGESSAGNPFGGVVNKGQAVKISTGAMLPEGADTVIPIEDCTPDGQKIVVHRVGKRSQHVRFAGEEFEEGALLVKAGTRLSSRHIALLASVGMSRLQVYRPPTVSVLITGSELVPPARPAQAHQLYDSNSVMLRLAVEEAGGVIKKVAWAPDDLPKTISVITESEDSSDLILFSGGVSVGPHDHVKEAVRMAGYETLFWKVKQKPGKPLFAAKKDTRLLIGLPGNPVSAYMCFAHYVRPLIRVTGGGTFTHPQKEARAKTDMRNKGQRPQLMRVRLEGLHDVLTAEPLSVQASHMLTSVTQADGYVILEANQQISKGEKITVFIF